MRLLDFIKNFFSPTVNTCVNVNIDTGKCEPDQKKQDEPISTTGLGKQSPIDSEILTDFIAELQYEKEPGDKIHVKMGNKSYDLNEF